MSPVRAAVMAEGLTWVGTPYRHQGATKGVGCDCLGLVRGIWAALYGRIAADPGAYAPDWAEVAAGEPLLEAARSHCIESPVAEAAAGDLIVFRWRSGVAAKHLGILFPEDRFLHAYEGHAVMLSPLVPQWRRRIVAAFRFPDLTAKE